MIIVKLMGGLGNQMFQYAAGRRLAVKHNTILKLDATIYDAPQKGLTPRYYELKCFNIREEFATPDEISSFCPTQIVTRQRIKRVFAKLFIVGDLYVREPYFHFYKKALSLPDNVYLEGYWQSEKYFEEIKDVIGHEFTVKYELSGRNRELSQLIDDTESVSIHVRRGDYVTNREVKQVHGACSVEYYMKCIKALRKEISRPHFFVFSDEPAWAREHLKLSFNMTFVNHNPPTQGYEDLRLMSQCKHNIIANSSFSWWGAWLNNNPNKIVFAPKKWFNSKTLDTKDLIPQSWIRI